MRYIQQSYGFSKVSPNIRIFSKAIEKIYESRISSRKNCELEKRFNQTTFLGDEHRLGKKSEFKEDLGQTGILVKKKELIQEHEQELI